MATTQPALEPLLGPEGYSEAWDEIKSDMYYDRNGQPMTLRAWSTGLSLLDYRILATTMVGKIEVITAWTGLDIDCNLCEVPHIFGTIEHHPNGAYVDEELSKTEAEALDTHNRRVSELEKEHVADRKDEVPPLQPAEQQRRSNGRLRNAARARFD